MEIVKTYPDFKLKALTFSFDDGTYQDVEMINMFRLLSLKGTFNINSNVFGRKGDFIHPSWLLNKRLDESQIKELYEGFEVASHTSNHKDLIGLSNDELEFEIGEDIKNISSLVGYQVKGFAYPFGSYDDNAIACLKRHGVVYARGVKHTYDFEIPSDFYTYGGSIEMSDSTIEAFCDKWLALMPQEMKLLYIWGHSYELDMFHEHERFFHVLEKIANKEDTYYATNIEIFSYINNLKKLEIKENSIFNNSESNIYLIVDGKKTIIKPFQTIKY